MPEDDVLSREAVESPDPGFGRGVRSGLSAFLARMETRGASERRLARSPRLSRVKEEQRWWPTPIARALRELVRRVE